MKGATKTILLLAVAVFVTRPAGHRLGAGEPRTLVWDTCKRFTDANVDLGKRDGWQPLAPGTSAGYAFKGDAVLENDKLQVLFSAGCGGPRVYGRSDVGKDRRRMSLVPLNAKQAQCCTITSLKVTENTGDASRVLESSEDEEIVPVRMHRL